MWLCDLKVLLHGLEGRNVTNLLDRAVRSRPINSIFRKGQSLGVRFTFLLAISLALIFVDQRFEYLSQARSLLSVLVMPIQWLSDSPARLIDGVRVAVSSRTELSEENARLKARNLILEQKLQKFASLNAQNVRLRELLNSSRLVNEKVLVAELIGINPDPNIREVLINKGQRDGVYEGQPLLDASGVVGQIVKVTPFTSQAILITDDSSRIPVMVNRNGYRAIAAGSESQTTLDLLHVPVTAEIRVGDLLVTSGMGQRFPVGYPVAEVTSLQHKAGRPFLDIQARPLARLNNSRLVMLVFTDERKVFQDENLKDESPKHSSGSTSQ